MSDIKDNENNIENDPENPKDNVNNENDNQDDLKNKSEKSKDLNDNKTDLPENEQNDDNKSKDNLLTPSSEEKDQTDKSKEISENTSEEPTQEPLNENKETEKTSEKIPEENSTEAEFKESIYQISLADENNLKIKVLLHRTINIDCYVRGDKTHDIQTSKITLNPDSKNPDREIEVVISIDANDASKENTTASKESNYKINLVNDDTLKVKVTTNKILAIDCYYKGEQNDSQFNKIIVNPRQDLSKQDIEIFISSEASKTQPSVLDEGITQEEAFQKGILIPNPEVADLINSEPVEEKIPLTEDERITEALKKNPFVRQREIYRRNLMRAAVTANIVFIIAIFIFYAWGSQEETPMTSPNPSRIVILQDLPDPKINLENVADPNKPEEEETETQDASVTIRQVTPRRISRPPIVRNTPIETPTSSDTTDMSSELDSIRKANQLADSLRASDTTNTAYQIPDSLKKDFTEGEVGLTISALPKSWKVIDAREMNTNINQFEGVVLVDTTVGSGDVNVFVSLDRDEPDFKQEEYSEAFEMMDTTITGFKSKPRTLAGMTEYKFYLFTPTEKISVGAKIRKEQFDAFKDIVEAVVRSIRIVPPPTPSGDK